MFNYSQCEGRALEPLFPVNKIKDQSDRFEDVKLVGGNVVQGNGAPSGFLRHYPSTSELWYPTKSLNQRRYVQAPPATLFIYYHLRCLSHILTRKRIPDDSSSSVTQVKSYPKRDAYQFPTEDPDEEWTTLPSKKRKRKPKFSPVFVIFLPVLTSF